MRNAILLSMLAMLLLTFAMSVPAHTGPINQVLHLQEHLQLVLALGSLPILSYGIGVIFRRRKLSTTR